MSDWNAHYDRDNGERGGGLRRSNGQSGRLGSHRRESNGTGIGAGHGGVGGGNPFGDETTDDLTSLERRLRTEVDEDFFQDPKKFRTLKRLVDVLGAQLLDEEVGQTGYLGFKGESDDFDNLRNSNPAYLALRRQQRVVEESIEYMTVSHCGDLNASVVAVGKVARQFNEAVQKVRLLRRQVREVKEHLGTHKDGEEDAGAAAAAAASQAAAAEKAGVKSLRELWLKKLEYEAVLSLLRKLEVIRRAPTSFDLLVTPGDGGQCRIGAAVVLLSDALQTMFSDDVAQVRALHKITEQLMTRKQRAEEVIWNALADVVYLRTGNAVATGELGEEIVVGGTLEGGDKKGGEGGGGGGKSKSDPKRRHRYVSSAPPASRHPRTGALEYGGNDEWGDDDVGDDDDDSMGMLSDDDDDDDVSIESSVKSGRRRSTAAVTSVAPPGSALDSYQTLLARGGAGRAIPRVVLEDDLDLEADEMRCLEDYHDATGSRRAVQNFVDPRPPRYADPVLALRILVEALAKLGRLDDVERVVGESVEIEVRRIAQAEQMRTTIRMDRRRSGERTQRGGGVGAAAMQAQDVRAIQEAMRDFRLHLRNILIAFGSVMLRLSHLAQILRHRVTTDPSIQCPSYSDPTSALHSVLVTAESIMQREVKYFLDACLKDSDASNMAMSLLDDIGIPDLSGPGGRDGGNLGLKSNNKAGGAGRNIPNHERGLFSLGIADDSSSGGKNSRSLASLAAGRMQAMELPGDQFVANVLFPRTNMHPSVRHALSFRRSVATWTQECEDLRMELSLVSGEDTSVPSYGAGAEEPALTYLDFVIQQEVLPKLKYEADNGVIRSLERGDAFEPILDGGLYPRGGSRRGAMEVQMCAACQALYMFTEPLFAALHRLPRGGEMYSSVVADLELAVLTFNSRVKQRVTNITKRKKSQLLLDDNNSFASDIELRSSYSSLMHAYFGEEDIYGVGGRAERAVVGGIVPLQPSPGDTQSNNARGGRGGHLSPKANGGGLGGATDLEREEEAFEREITHLYPLLDFSGKGYGKDHHVCNDDELARAATLAHGLLKVSSLLEGQLRTKGSGSWKAVGATRALQEAIKTIRSYGVRMAKFCRVDMLIQTVKRMSKISMSSTLVAKDAVRLPSCVNDLGEYLTAISEILREAGGNNITAYTFSSLEQYIPLFLMQTVRIIAKGRGLPRGFIITLNGVEALDRSGSVLYRDLKGATGFEGSFWDDEVAADAFERSASYVAMIELKMDELLAYFEDNMTEFSDEDYKLMFGINGPRRLADIGKYTALKGRAGK